MSVQAAYRIDGRHAEGAAFYAVACDPARSVVVEACAGAGKTWMLVSRILRALLDGVEPQQILAITFTRKAAGEMRERLGQWLREFARADEAERIEALRQRGLDAARAAELAPALAALHERLLVGGRAVDIRTFHGWFSQLLRAAPLDMLQPLGLSPGVDLIEDTEDLQADLFRRFHAAVRAEPALREDFVALVRRRGRTSLRHWLEAAWMKRSEFEAADAAGTLESGVPPAAALWPGYAPGESPALRLRSPAVHAVFAELVLKLGQQTGATPRKHAVLLEQALALADPQEALEAVSEALLTKEGKPRSRLEAPGLPEALAWLAEIRAAVEQQQAHEEHARMVRLARVLLAEYAALKRQRGLADMADLEHCALHLLRDASLAGWVQERLDQRIRQVLIDEFQDTSPLQWRALHGWLSAYAGAGGAAPSVFVVGDPKQSIYRFRGAEPRVFAAAREFVAEALQGSVLECDHTRRNAPEVLALVNTVFGTACERGEFDGFRAHTTGAASVAQGPALRSLPRIERPPRAVAEAAEPVWRDSLLQPRREPELGLRQMEAAQVAAAVESLLQEQGLRPGEVFVLARKRAPLREAARALQARGLPYAAPEDNALMAAPEVRDLVAVLDVLASPAHDLALAHALRSPLFGAADADLLQLAAQARGGAWWPALMRLGESASPALQRAAALLARWAALMDRLPPHDLLDRIVAEGELMPRLLAAVPAARRQGAREAVQALLALALQLDGARYASVYGFVRALRRRALKAPAGTPPDAVQLLTVHGAKGLEARAVILMDADAPAARAESATLLVDWPVQADAPRCCAFVASEARCPPSLQPVLDHERAARQREEVNGLYVALTRAREQLVLSAVAPHQGGSDGSWWARLAALAQPWALAAAGAGPRLAAQATLRRLPALPPPPLAAEAGTAADALQALIGQAFHRTLEWATDGNAAGLPALSTAACTSLGLAAEHHETVLAHARCVLASPVARRFFDASALAWAGNEVSVMDGDTALRIDRLVALDEGGRRTWWVLDYKLQPAPLAVPAYLEQIRRYRALVARLQPGDAVRAAFVTAAGEVLEADQ